MYKVIAFITGALALAGFLINTYFISVRGSFTGLIDLLFGFAMYVWIILPFLCIFIGGNYMWEERNIASSIIFFLTASIVTAHDIYELIAPHPPDGQYGMVFLFLPILQIWFILAGFGLAVLIAGLARRIKIRKTQRKNA